MTEELPYQAKLDEAARLGKVLHREDIYGSGPPVDGFHQELMEVIARESGPRVLDIGCGLAPYANELNRRGFSAVGVELDQDVVLAGVELGRLVLPMDGRALAFADRSFDTCLLIEVIEHVEQFEQILLEAARVARNNVIISVPNIGVIPKLYAYNVVPWHMLEATHINFFTPESLNAILQSIFQERANIRVQGYAPAFPWTGDPTLYYQISAVVGLQPTRRAIWRTVAGFARASGDRRF